MLRPLGKVSGSKGNYANARSCPNKGAGYS